jgi:hypothetical protein
MGDVHVVTRAGEEPGLGVRDLAGEETPHHHRRAAVQFSMPYEQGCADRAEVDVHGRTSNNKSLEKPDSLAMTDR